MSCCPCSATSLLCPSAECPCRSDQDTHIVGETAAGEPALYSVLLFKGKKKAKRFRRDVRRGVYRDTRLVLWGGSKKSKERWIILEEARAFDEAIDTPGVHTLLTYTLEYVALDQPKLAMIILDIAIDLEVAGCEARAFTGASA